MKILLFLIIPIFSFSQNIDTIRLSKDTSVVVFLTQDSTITFLEGDGHSLIYSGFVPFRAGSNSFLNIKNLSVKCDGCFTWMGRHAWGGCKKRCAVQWINTESALGQIINGKAIRHPLPVEYNKYIVK